MPQLSDVDAWVNRADAALRSAQRPNGSGIFFAGLIAVGGVEIVGFLMVWPTATFAFVAVLDLIKRFRRLPTGV
jgi:hypothetical protein